MPTQVASDNFNRADGAEGANWTAQNNGFNVATNLAQGTSGAAANESFWSANVFENDQYSQVKMPTTQDGGPTLRASGTGAGNNYYQFEGKIASNTVITKVVAGVQTNLQTGLASVANGSVTRIEVVGTTIQCFDDGVQIGTDQSDGALTSGSAGKASFANTTTFDDWSGGNMSSAVPVPVRVGGVARPRPKRRVFPPGSGIGA